MVDFSTRIENYIEQFLYIIHISVLRVLGIEKDSKFDLFQIFKTKIFILKMS